MAIKVTKGQISDGTVSKNTCHKEYYLCGKFLHSFMKKYTMLSILGATLLYYITILSYIVIFTSDIAFTMQYCHAVHM